MNTESFWHTWLSTNLNLSAASVQCLVERFTHVGLALDSEILEDNTRTLALGVELARKVGFPEAQLADFRRGALLHDLGKLLLPPEIFNKPSPLTPADWAVIRRHPDYSYLLLCGVPELEAALDIPVAHHECWDGSGYPRGWKGTEIPLAARIFAIVDCWDALISLRPYRPPFSASEARGILQKLSGKSFEPRILDQFLAMEAVRE